MVRCLNGFAVACALVALLWINNAVLWPFTGIRYSINSESARLMRWTDAGYDSWGWDYSAGHQYQPDGTWKNLWHRPTWRHARWRNTANISGEPRFARREGDK